MGSAPALEFPVERRAAWHAAVALLVLLCCSVTLLWWAAEPPLPEPAAFLLACAVGALALHSGAGLVNLPQSMRLHWDGRNWTVESAGQAPQVGQVAVALDLGAWMLLRFHCDGRPGLLQARWIPVQRQESAGLWHALRCAVHGRRTGADAPV